MVSVAKKSMNILGNSLAITDGSGSDYGYLREITESTLADDVVVEKLTKWRNRFGKFFLTQFVATPERTKRWLSKAVVGNPSRALFLIYTSDNELVGTIGLTNITSDSAELDNLLRGEMGGDPKLIHFAEVALISWAFDTFGVAEIFLGVFSNNFMAITLHEGVGFVKAHTSTLSKQVVNGETHYHVVEDGEQSAPFFYQHMVLSSSDFNRISKGKGGR